MLAWARLWRASSTWWWSWALVHAAERSWAASFRLTIIHLALRCWRRRGWKVVAHWRSGTLHWRQLLLRNSMRVRVMGCLRWVIILVHSTLFLRPTSLGRAATEVAWRSRWATVVYVTQTSSVLIRLGLLLRRGNIIFPLTHALWWSRWLTLMVSIHCCSFGSRESCCWWRCAISNASLWSAWMRLVLLMLIRSRRRSHSVVGDWSHLRTRAVSSPEWWHWTLCLRRWAIHAIGRRWQSIWRRRTAAAIVGV